jgi:hypothetical protein
MNLLLRGLCPNLFHCHVWYKERRNLYDVYVSIDGLLCQPIRCCPKNKQVKISPNMGTKVKHKKSVHTALPTKLLQKWPQSKHMTLTYLFSANFAANNNTWMMAMRKKKKLSKNSDGSSRTSS